MSEAIFIIIKNHFALFLRKKLNKNMKIAFIKTMIKWVKELPGYPSRVISLGQLNEMFTGIKKVFEKEK